MLTFCKFKSEPGYWNAFWKGEKYSNCNTLAKTDKSDYCEKHGCRVCSYVKLKAKYQNPPLDIKLEPEFGGEEVCSIECKDQEEERQKQNLQEVKSGLWMEITELNGKLNTEIKNIFLPLYNVVSGNEIYNLKRQLINEEIDIQQFTKECEKIINGYSLSDDEKDKWKKVYQKVDNAKDLRQKLVGFFEQEWDYLVVLAQKYKDLQEQKKFPECKKCKLRREQPDTWPIGCEDWCKECVEQKRASNNNDNHQPPVNDFPLTNSPKKNQENFPRSQDISNKLATSQTDRDKNAHNIERERERERESKPPSWTPHHQRVQITPGQLPKKMAILLCI